MENKRSIFRQESLDKVESPEKLDKYIKASRPSAWIFVIAVIILAVSLVVWGFTGKLPKLYNTKGVSMKNGTVACFIPPEELSASYLGCKVNIVLPDGKVTSGSVSDISSVPYSANEISEVLEKDWLTHQFVDDDYSKYLYMVEVITDETISEDYIVSASIVTDNVRPIVYLFN